MVGVRKCYLCARKKTGNNNLTLHSFPKDQQIQEKWKYVCGLRTEDNVSRLYICSNHFKPQDYQCKNFKPGKLNNRAVPSVKVVNFESSTSTETVNSIKTEPTTPSETNVENSLAANQITDKSINSIPTTLSETNMEDSLAVNEITDENTEQQALKKRRFHLPRYISEIRTSDLTNLRRASQILKFVQVNDMRKSGKIHKLQKQIFNLKKKIAKLETMLSHSHLRERDLNDRR